MPHIVIEHSAEVEVLEIMQDLQHLVSNFGEFNPQAVKSRSISFKDFVLPEGNDDFVHVTISILAGRALELRQRLADEAFGLLQTQLPNVAKISLDICEMQPETYRKN